MSGSIPTSGVLRDLVDYDCRWDGGDTVPWGLDGHAEQQQETITGLVRNCDFEIPKLDALNMENLTDFEALMFGELSNDGSSEDDMESTTSSEDEGFFPFMELPLEIRLQVYRWLHLMTPIRLTQFAPWYPNPVFRAYYVKAVTLGMKPDPARHDPSVLEDFNGPPKQRADRPPLLSPGRPNCCLPTAILLANRQIYHESRKLPFLENEFVFVNWFASGLWAARSFVKGLRPWQLAMRYARLELLSRDLAGRYAKEWRELCEAWATGLRGLRLKILGGGGGGGGTSATGGMSWVVAGTPQKGAPPVRVRDSEGKAENWVENGLKLLKHLRCLEVELSVADWDDRTKLEWCRSVEEAVNEGRGDSEHHVRVCCVEREHHNERRYVCL